MVFIFYFRETWQGPTARSAFDIQTALGKQTEASKIVNPIFTYVLTGCLGGCSLKYHPPMHVQFSTLGGLGGARQRHKALGTQAAFGKLG